jgi:hypothetical protein
MYAAGILMNPASSLATCSRLTHPQPKCATSMVVPPAAKLPALLFGCLLLPPLPVRGAAAVMSSMGLLGRRRKALCATTVRGSWAAATWPTAIRPAPAALHGLGYCPAAAITLNPLWWVALLRAPAAAGCPLGAALAAPLMLNPSSPTAAAAAVATAAATAAAAAPLG